MLGSTLHLMPILASIDSAPGRLLHHLVTACNTAYCIVTSPTRDRKKKLLLQTNVINNKYEEVITRNRQKYTTLPHVITGQIMRHFATENGKCNN